MSKILDLVTIKIDLKMKGNFLAKITLNWQNEFEVRFCRLTMRPDGTLWFQPPALREFNWVKCFAVLEESEWKRLEQKVTAQFLELIKEKVHEGVISPAFLERLKNAKEEITEEDYEKLEKHLEDTDTHL